MASRKPDVYWSELSAGEKARYRERGIGPATFNAWRRKTQEERTRLTREARAKGYTSGLDERGWKLRVRKAVSPLDRARLAREAIRDKRRKVVPDLFGIEEEEHMQWVTLLSP